MYLQVNVGWAEPLIEVLREHPRALAEMVIDMIDINKNSSSGEPWKVAGSFDHVMVRMTV